MTAINNLLKTSRFRRFLGFITLLMLCLILPVGSTRADQSAANKIGFEIFKNHSSVGRVAVWPVDAKHAREANLSRSAAGALSESIRAAVQQAGSAKGVTFVEREAITKIFQEQQFSQGASDAEFEKLARQANADAIVIITVNRKDAANIIVSARMVGVKGQISGQILGASNAYGISITPQFNILLGGVFDSADHSQKIQLEPSFESGLSSRTGIKIVRPGSSGDPDFRAQASIAISVTDKVTQEAQGAQLFSGMFAGFAKQMGQDGNSPLAGISGGMKGFDQVGKYKVISASVTGQMKSTVDGSVLTADSSGSAELPGGAAQEQIRAEAQNLVRKLLKEVGAELGAKLLGDPFAAAAKGKAKGLLD